MPFPSAEFDSLEMVIETPRVSDVPDLAELTERFALSAGAQRESFRSHFPKDEAVWRTLIAAESIVCAKTGDGKVAGFYAANQFSLVSQPEELLQLRAAKNVLCNRLKLPDRSVGFGSQAVIDSRWQSSDLRPCLLRALLRTVGFRYRYVFSVVKKDNLAEMRALPREGWRCFHEEDDACYMMLDVAKALRLLASSLVLRIPNRPERSLGIVTQA